MSQMFRMTDLSEPRAGEKPRSEHSRDSLGYWSAGQSLQGRGFAEICEDAARLATGLLGWPPDVFWRATPQDLRLALEGRLGRVRAARAGLGKAELAALMARFPDKTEGGENG